MTIEDERLPKRRRQTYTTHRAKTPKPRIGIFFVGNSSCDLDYMKTLKKMLWRLSEVSCWLIIHLKIFNRNISKNS